MASSAKRIYHRRRELEVGFSFAQAVEARGLVFISGCLSWNDAGAPVAKGDFPEQVRNVYKDLQGVLSDHGLTFEHVVKENVYCRDMDAMVAAAPIRAEFLKGHQPPASTWVQIARLVNADLLLEVEMVAARPE